jgi:hypothetical protein
VNITDEIKISTAKGLVALINDLTNISQNIVNPDGYNIGDKIDLNYPFETIILLN